MSNITDQIKKILNEVNYAGMSKGVSAEDDLFEKGILDSLSMVQFIVAIEKEFNIKISNKDIKYETFTSLKEIEKFLTSRVS